MLVFFMGMEKSVLKLLVWSNPTKKYIKVYGINFNLEIFILESDFDEILWLFVGFVSSHWAKLHWNAWAASYDG